MWQVFSFLLLLAWKAKAQQPSISNSLYGRQGAATFQTQFQQLPPSAQAPPLPANGVYMWGEWGMFSACSVTCGRGIMRRQRTCYVYEQSRRRTSNGGRSSTLQALLPLMLMSGEGTSNMDLSTIMDMLGTRQGDSGPSQMATAQFQTQRQIGCPGDQIGGATCGGMMCPFPPTEGPVTSMPPRPTIGLPNTALIPSVCLTQWGPWGQCSSSCGRAVRLRMRECNCRDPNSGLESCSEMLTTSQLCVDLPPCLPLPTSKAETSPPTSAPTLPPVTEATGTWSSWSFWTTCPTECGRGGSATRRRRCSGSGICYGKFREIRQCPSIPCTPLPPFWGGWKEYGDCSTTCGVGKKSRSRECSIPGACSGVDIETVPCVLRPCPTPSPEWSQWGAYTVCSASCGKGVRSRSRICPVEGGCLGNPVEISECENGPCPTLPPPPSWGEWRAYGACSKTCGIGKQSRSRECSIPGACFGVDIETVPCVLRPCPTPTPTWSQWEAYTVCSTTCGNGLRSRSRTCPVPGSCPGKPVEVSDCRNRPCPTIAPPPPEWSQWEPYSDCSTSCGVGTKFRRRACPIKGSCPGNAVETSECTNQPCPTTPPPPTWSSWGAFTDCTKTCGLGIRVRRRTCPVSDGCLGFAEEAIPCAMNDCPEPTPVWLEWGPYGACSTTCGAGLKFRRRICPIIGQCAGNSAESSPCNVDVSCPTSPPELTWSQWSSFSDCSMTCGLGEKTRTRTCSVSGACEGLDSVTIPCLVRRCAILPEWAQWGEFGECSSTCGAGQRTRVRECTADGKCKGASDDTVPCTNEPCPTLPPSVPTWNLWSPFTPCNTTCGEGSRTRYRTCPVAGGCIGSSVEFTSCDNSACIVQPGAAQWGNWGRFSSCSETCGVGRQVRFRSCPSRNACVGSGLQERICTNEPCLACNFTTVSERQDCGFPGISRTACRERGCCYDDARDGLIWCFHGKRDSNEDVMIGQTIPETDLDDQPERA